MSQKQQTLSDITGMKGNLRFRFSKWKLFFTMNHFPSPTVVNNYGWWYSNKRLEKKRKYEPFTMEGDLEIDLTENVMKWNGETLAFKIMYSRSPKNRKWTIILYHEDLIDLRVIMGQNTINLFSHPRHLIAE